MRKRLRTFNKVPLSFPRKRESMDPRLKHAGMTVLSNLARKSFTVTTRKVVFSKGPIHLVDCEVSMPDGRILSRQILEHPGSVVIIPKVARDRYLLIRQFRFAARGWLWEIPAGGVEKGETFAQAAKRELIEEVGYRPRRLKKLLHFYPTPGVSGEMMHLYLAEDLVPDSAEQDEDEEIEIHEFNTRQISAMIRRGKIIDAKTILAFYYLSRTLSKRHPK